MVRASAAMLRSHLEDVAAINPLVSVSFTEPQSPTLRDLFCSGGTETPEPWVGSGPPQLG